MGPATPTVFVLAGPNGAGKTSLYWHEASEIPRLNGDTLYQQHQDLHEVEALLRKQQEEWVRERRSFVIETNAASERDYALFGALKSHGYRIELRYVGLKSIVLCQERVAQRVAEGGHDVAPAFIEQRYRNSLSLLKTHYRVFDQLQLYDNSDEEPILVADFLPDSPLNTFGSVPAWANSVVLHIIRMEGIYQKLPKQ